MSEKKKFLIKEFQELCENGLCEDLLTEQEREMKKNGAVILSGKLSEANTVNGNQRIYKKNLLEREMEKFNQLIKDNMALGNVDHDDSEVIELSKASHMFLRTWWTGDDLFGTCKVLTTPQGKVLEALIRDGVKLGVSSRGIGSLRELANGVSEVEDDFQLVTYDIVSYPSAPGAFMKLQEGKMLKELSQKTSRKHYIDVLFDDILKKEKK